LPTPLAPIDNLLPTSLARCWLIAGGKLDHPNNHRLISTTTAARSLAQAMLSAAEAGDDAGIALLSEIAYNQLGSQRAGGMLMALPTQCHPQAVPTVLWTLHQDNWLSVARDVIHKAVCQLSHCGYMLGKDISFSSTEAGEPVLHMTTETHQQITEESPGSLRLIESFLQVQ
jgi:hypothetical protein